MADSLPSEVELFPITTTGDRRTGDAPPPEDKARFVKEIEEALLAGDVDLAVHSAKDVPGELPDGLSIVGVPERADPRDALCGASSLAALPDGAVVGTGSLRRRSQLLALRPDLDVRDLRGNVDTRLRRLADGDYDAVVLAAAGLARLGRADEGAPVDADDLLPAAGQGCLALEARTDDERVAEAAAAVTDPPRSPRCWPSGRWWWAWTRVAARPMGALARLDGDELALAAYVGMPDGGQWIRDALRSPPPSPPRSGGRWRSGCCPPGAAELLAAAERAATSVPIVAEGTVYLVGAGPGDPGLHDPPRAGADRARPTRSSTTA